MCEDKNYWDGKKWGLRVCCRLYHAPHMHTPHPCFLHYTTRNTPNCAIKWVNGLQNSLVLSHILIKRREIKIVRHSKRPILRHFERF